MRVRNFLFVILIAFAAASAIAALTTMRQVKLEAAGRHVSDLRIAPSRSFPVTASLAPAFRSQMS
ncbi:MAG TPA: hypothetical protein VMM15_40970 [Bradyrhizobium sp.]|nr:hypothetical protein [Bradyrhizobium sp.]